MICDFVRPLPEKMIKYAREDTHYLLYIYDRMRNELIRRGNSLSNLITVVLKNSKEICLKQYEKQVYDEKGYKKLCRKFRRSLKPQQVQFKGQIEYETSREILIIVSPRPSGQYGDTVITSTIF
jgi:hypothetical protein